MNPFLTDARSDPTRGHRSLPPGSGARKPPSAGEAGHPSLAPDARVVETVLELRQPFELESGGLLPRVRVGVRLAGVHGAPVVAALGGISACRRSVTLPGEEGAGWWQDALGDKGVDLPGRFRVLGLDWLGGAGESTGPACASVGETPFPAVSAGDQARLLEHALDALGIDRLEAVVSASYGGMVAQRFAARCPGRVGRLLIMACAHRPDPMAVARRRVQKQILDLAGDDEAAGVALARALAMTTYRSAAEFRQRFGGEGGQDELGSYLDHQGRKFARRFDRASYRCLLDSIDTHHFDPASLEMPLDLLGFSTDELCPPDLLREFAAAAPGLRRCRIVDSDFGHDAFLCEAALVARAIDECLTGDTP